MLRTTPHCLAALLIVACGSPQGLEEDEFPDRYAQSAIAGGGTGAAPVGNVGTGGSGNAGGNGGAGGSSGRAGSGSSATNGGSGGGGLAGSGSAGNGSAGNGSAGSGNASGAGGAGSSSQSGTAGSGSASAPPAGACPDDITLLFNRPSSAGGCADGGCHIAGGFPPDLVSPNVEMRLLNVASTCQSRPYIGASDSFLLEKVTKAMPACGGAQMPFFAAQNLSAADRQCIADWIDDVGGGG